MSGASDGRSCTRVRLLSGMLVVQCTIHRHKARRFSSPSMLVTGVSTRSHRRHTMPAVVGQTSTMDAWVTWAYNDVFMHDGLLWQKVSKPLTEFQSSHNDTDFNLDLRLLTSHPHYNILRPLFCILFVFTTAGPLYWTPISPTTLWH